MRKIACLLSVCLLVGMTGEASADKITTGLKIGAALAVAGTASVVVMANQEHIRSFAGDTLAIVPWNRYTLAAYYKTLTPEQKQIYIDKLQEYNQKLMEKALEMKAPELYEQYSSYKEKFESLKGNYENFSEVANDLIMIKKSWQGIFNHAYAAAEYFDKEADYTAQHAGNYGIRDEGNFAKGRKEALSQYQSAADTLFYSAKAVVDAAKTANVGGRVAGTLGGDKLIESLSNYAGDMAPKEKETTTRKVNGLEVSGEKTIDQLEKEHSQNSFNTQQSRGNEVIRSGNLP